jgi:hypothetical protein
MYSRQMEKDLANKDYVSAVVHQHQKVNCYLEASRFCDLRQAKQKERNCEAD